MIARVIITILIILAALYFGLLYILYTRSIRCTDKQKRQPVRLPKAKGYIPYHEQMSALVSEMEQQPFETVEIRSRDGLLLRARYLHVRDGAPVMIQAHGYRSGGIRDMCGANKIARENGINSLLIDMRAHGRSEGHTLTFGIKERYDILDWISYLQTRFGKETPLFLSGVSMGAATVLMTAELPLPNAVKGILADSPYTSPEDIVRVVIKKNNLPENIFFPLVNQSARLFGHVDLRCADVRQAVKKSPVPILLIHGTEDHFVPFEMSMEIRDANPEKVRLLLVKGAPHGIGYIVDTHSYVQAVLEFVKENT